MRLMRPILIAVFVIGAFFVMGIGVESAHAVPPFAKKYGTGCNTCHVAPPKLNGFGQAFRLNGYFWPGKNGAKDDDSARKIKTFELGKTHFKPTGGNRATLDQTPLIGFWAQINAYYNPKRENRSNTPQTTMANFSLDFMFAGTLGDSISYFNIIATDAGQNPGLEVLFVNFNDIAVPNWINLRLGRTLRGPLSAHSADTLNYGKSHFDSGDMAPYSSQGQINLWRMSRGGSGADLWGFGSFGNNSVGYQLSLITDFNNTVENNYQKTFYGFLEYQYGGVRWGDGGGKIDDLSARLRVFFATGTANISNAASGTDPTTNGVSPVNSKNTAFGGELEVGIKGFEILAMLAYLKQNQETASGVGVYNVHLTNLYIGVEAHYELVGGSIIPVIRWEKSAPTVKDSAGNKLLSQGRHFLDISILFQVRPNVQIKPGVVLELNASDVNKFDNNTTGVNKYQGNHKTFNNIGLWVNYGF